MTVYKILHKPSGKFITPEDCNRAFYATLSKARGENLELKFTSNKGGFWVTKSVVEKRLKLMEQLYPNEFELKSYDLEEVTNV